MKTLIGAFALLSLTTAVAWADDAPPAEEKPEATDCSTLEGDAKTTCETAQKADEPKEDKKKGKSMEKSEDNRMEGFDEDE